MNNNVLLAVIAIMAIGQIGLTVATILWGRHLNRVSARLAVTEAIVERLIRPVRIDETLDAAAKTVERSEATLRRSNSPANPNDGRF